MEKEMDKGKKGGEWNFEEEKKSVKRGNGSKRKRRKMIKKEEEFGQEQKLRQSKK